MMSFVLVTCAVRESGFSRWQFERAVFHVGRQVDGGDINTLSDYLASDLCRISCFFFYLFLCSLLRTAGSSGRK